MKQRSYRVDRFKVPARSRAEFLDAVNTTHNILRTVPGFVHDAVLEHDDESGRFNFVTLVIWESPHASAAARSIVSAAQQRAGFSREETLTRLGIEADLGQYHEVSGF